LLTFLALDTLPNVITQIYDFFTNEQPCNDVFCVKKFVFYWFNKL